MLLQIKQTLTDIKYEKHIWFQLVAKDTFKITKTKTEMKINKNYIVKNDI